MIGSRSATRMHSRRRILYVNHPDRRCGVYQFGKNIGRVLALSTRFRFTYVECADPLSFNVTLLRERPDCVIYNYHPRTLGWAKRNALLIPVPQVAMIHEVFQGSADAATNEFFDYHIGADPMLLLKNPIVYKTGRLIPAYENRFPPPAIPTIGSFGFGTPGKGFEKVVARVQKEFDQAIIRLHIPFASFGDDDGTNARAIAAACRQMLKKPGVELRVTHDFMDDAALLDFLGQNSINVFLYDQVSNRGISSSTDYALAVDRPIAISESSMFRHLHTITPTIVVPHATLKEILANSTAPLAEVRAEWTHENLLWDYERIVDDVLRRGKERKLVRKLARIAKRRVLRRPTGAARSPWVRPDATLETAHERNPPAWVQEVPADAVPRFNRILDNDARELYAGIIEQLFTLVPAIMRRKIPEANVQQAFVLDTALKMAKRFAAPRVLAVGSYEDSAVAALKILGFDVTEVDPIINFDLHTYLLKPGARREFDVVVSTSVIEHVSNDVQFVREIAAVLAENGVAILTCDYDDRYQPGDPIPSVNYRFYTQADIKQRLMTAIPECALVDMPQWDCSEPDFILADRFRYTFASIVFKRAMARDRAARLGS